jgi:hypothetical protein
VEAIFRKFLRKKLQAHWAVQDFCFHF